MAPWKRIVQPGAQLVKSRRLLLDPSSSRSSPSSFPNQLARHHHAAADDASAKSPQQQLVKYMDMLKLQNKVQSDMSKFQSELLSSQERQLARLQREAETTRAEIMEKLLDEKLHGVAEKMVRDLKADIEKGNAKVMKELDASIGAIMVIYCIVTVCISGGMALLFKGFI